ncbi:MAG: ROK family protein [Actinobacteria bacterium]|nr:MAG: ROK family protein [Actinomycetota bacterium]
MSSPMSAPVIGIDLRPTNVATAVLHEGQLDEPLVEPPERSDPARLIDQLAAMVKSARTDDLLAVGIGVPRIVEWRTGRVVSTSRASAPATNGALGLPLADVPLRQVLEERLGVPVFVDNAANVGALAEAHDDELELVARHLVMFTVGTHVGSGLVLGGRIYRGATGAAGELGHTILGLDLAGAVPAPMGFPQPGSLEFVVAGHALDRLAALAGRVHPKSALARFRAEGKPVLSAHVIEAALDGDESAARMVEIWGQRIGVAVANAVHTFDPEEVVIGGDAARAGLLLLEPARRVALEYVLPGLGARTTIRLARHGIHAGVLGAALLARSELEPDVAG